MLKCIWCILSLSITKHSIQYFSTRKWLCLKSFRSIFRLYIGHSVVVVVVILQRKTVVGFLVNAFNIFKMTICKFYHFFLHGAIRIVSHRIKCTLSRVHFAKKRPPLVSENTINGFPYFKQFVNFNYSVWLY